MPAQDRLGRDEERRPALAGHEPGQSGNDLPVPPGESRPSDLAAQHGQLLTKDQDLRVLGQGVNVVDSQKVDDTADQAVEEGERHGQQDCGSDRAWSKRRSSCWTLQDLL